MNDYLGKILIQQYSEKWQKYRNGKFKKNIRVMRMILIAKIRVNYIEPSQLWPILELSLYLGFHIKPLMLGDN